MSQQIVAGQRIANRQLIVGNHHTVERAIRIQVRIASYTKDIDIVECVKRLDGSAEKAACQVRQSAYKLSAVKIAIAGNVNARGLEKDRKLITPIIESLGHETCFLQYDNPGDEKHSIILCLEVVSRKLVSLSDAPPWLLVNCEWLTPETVKIVQRSYTKILCKTREAHRICKELFGEKAQYCGFISEDRFDASVPRKNVFLHVAGQSKAKNTTAIIDAWRWKRNGEAIKVPLFMVSDFPMEDLPERVYLVNHMGDADLKHLQNECQHHLQPSACEGFGHVLHEAMSVNANILTVDSPPMNEIHAAYKIPSTGSTQFNSVRMHEVSAIDIHCAVQDMLRLGRNGFAAAGMPRKEFLDGNEAFKKAFTAHLAEIETKPTVSVPRVRSEKPCIAFVGNFSAEHSTENQILWALEQGLGYEVEKLQENKVNAQDIRSACEYNQILMWIRTPGWLKIPDDEMINFLAELKRKGIKSVACHLDKFWNIPDREFLIGRIPFWKCEYVFTADGSRQEDFAKRGVNHFWMRPAVSEVYCHPGTPRDEYRCDVGFVGAGAGYHDIYPFRQELLKFLTETYGSRFKHVEGVRGHLLNDVYASMRVIIGDCFNAGTPYYASDRIMETTGRFGFLLHPRVLGFEDVPCMFYKPQDLDDLRVQIGRCLEMNDKARQFLRWACAEHVMKHDTWQIRMWEILRIVSGESNGKKEHATGTD